METTNNHMTEAEVRAFNYYVELSGSAADNNDNESYKYCMEQTRRLVRYLSKKYDWISSRDDIENYIYGAPVGTLAGYGANLANPGLGK